MALTDKPLDKFGQQINPGDVCVWHHRREGIKFLIYKGIVYGGKGSKGEYGSFISGGDRVTVKYSSTVFVFSPLTKRRSMAREVQSPVRSYYEGKT